MNDVAVKIWPAGGGVINLSMDQPAAEELMRVASDVLCDWVTIKASDGSLALQMSHVIAIQISVPPPVRSDRK